MMLIPGCTWRIAATALVFALTGCSDFSQHRFGGIRRSSDTEEGPPKAAAALHIPNAPSTARPLPLDKVQQATFVPGPDAPMQPEIVDNPLRTLYQRAAQRHALMESYIFRLKRREVVNGRKQPEELVKVQLRREPYSVHLVWLGKEGKGREAIYVKGKYKNQMQLLLAAGDVPFFPAGMRYSISPDDSTAKSRSRHPITETGFGSTIESFGRVVAAIEKNDPREGTMKYLGRVKRDEFEAKVEAVMQVLPANNSDPLLPKGGRRFWFFDATTGLPVLYITHDPDGEVEYYCLDGIIWPAPMDDNDFNPERVWKK